METEIIFSREQERWYRVMRFEMGGEFWDVPARDETNSFFSKTTQWFLSGRSALQSIVRELKTCHTVAMPSWCCDSMIKPFIEAGIDVHFYPVYWQGDLVQELKKDCDALFLIDYFGYPNHTSTLEHYKGVIIRDVTHSIFSSSYSDADYYFGSLRKWCGIWTGGYAWTGDGHKLFVGGTSKSKYADFRKKAMQLKNGYINGKGVTDKKFLKIFEHAEAELEVAGISPATERDIVLAEKLDVNYIKDRRRANAEVLMHAFKGWTVFGAFEDSDCPMFVPIMVPNGRRDELHQYLIEKGIYCPIHWPITNYHKLSKKERYIYDNEISLVCDQRYSEEDMNKIVKTVQDFMGEK